MTLKRAIVTSVGPLRIKIDGDTEPIPFTPKSGIDPATLAVGDVVHADQSGHRLVVLVRVGGLGLVSGRNLIVNGDFRINQRGAVAGAFVGTGVYFLDRWFAPGGGTGTTTWADDGGVRTLTLGDGGEAGYVDQIIEASSLPAGTYTASWEGTAKLYIFALNPVYADSPVTFTSDGTANVKFQFRGNGETLRNVKLEWGSVPTPFATSPLGEELALCQRYYQRFGGQSAYQSFALGFARSTTAVRISIPIPVSMRASPTLTYSTVTLFNGDFASVSALATTSSGISNVIQVDATSSGLTTYRPYSLISYNDTSGYVAFDAEL